MLYTFSSRKASYQQKCARTNIENQKENKTRKPMKKSRKAQHASEENLPCVATIAEHQPGANSANTEYIIFKGLGLVSQQKVSSSKLLYCYHSNHYISRTRDLCSLLLGGYCSTQTQALFARASASYHPPPHPSHKLPALPNNRYTQAHTHTKITHCTFSSRTQLLRHTLKKKSVHYTDVHCGPCWRVTRAR